MARTWKSPANRAALDRFRAQRLARLVRHAAARVPYYRARFAAAGVRPGSVRGLEDLPTLPIIRRSEVQAQTPRALCAAGMSDGGLVFHDTGGSTGEPLTVRRTWLEERVLQVLRRRAMLGVGVWPSDRRALIADFWPQTAGPRPRQRPRTLSLRDLAGVFRDRAFDCHLEPEPLHAALVNYAPDVLSGFPGTLVRLALVDEQARERLRPRLVSCGGEILTRQARDVIRKIFGTPVFDTYGANEFNLLAWECAESGLLHVCDEGVILEILDARGRAVAPGERGEVVATALHSFAMPFVRYALGDLAERGPDPCPCGCLLPTIKVVQGRQLDLFRLPGGRWLHPYELIDRIYVAGMEWVGQYQLIQEAEDRIRLLVRPRSSIPPGGLDRLAATVRERCGAGVAASVETVADIPPGPNGKTRVTYSRITGPVG